MSYAHIRLLLNNGEYQGEYIEEESDVNILNLNTYDEFDWIIFIISLTTFACIFFCTGWCFHKICVHDKIFGNSDEDVETLSTKLSMRTQRGQKALDFFRGLSLRGSIRGNSNRPAIANRSNPYVSKNKNKNKNNTPKLYENGSIKRSVHWKNDKKSSSTALKVPVPHLPRIPSHEETDCNQTSTDIINVLDTALHKKNSVIYSNKALKKKRSTTTLATPGLPSPGSTIASETHISMQIPMEYSENPYKTAVAAQRYSNVMLAKIAEHINKDKDEVIIVYDDANDVIDEDMIDATTPLTTPL